MQKILIILLFPTPFYKQLAATKKKICQLKLEKLTKLESYAEKKAQLPSIDSIAYSIKGTQPTTPPPLRMRRELTTHVAKMQC